MIARDVAVTGNAMDKLDDTQRAVWRVMVSTAGEYRVSVRGSFLGIGVSPQLWLGHKPPVPGTAVPLVGAALGFVVTLVWSVIWLLFRRKRAYATT